MGKNEGNLGSQEPAKVRILDNLRAPHLLPVDMAWLPSRPLRLGAAATTSSQLSSKMLLLLDSKSNWLGYVRQVEQGKGVQNGGG